jgi:hypothetical protein
MLADLGNNANLRIRNGPISLVFDYSNARCDDRQVAAPNALRWDFGVFRVY